MKPKILKHEARILGIDDGPFDKFKRGKVFVVGAVFRGGLYPDAILSTEVQADGDDSTSKIIEMIKNCRQRKQLHAVIVKGIALGGFNVIDINEVFMRTRVPVIIVVRDYPDFGKIEAALLHKIRHGKGKMELICRAGNPIEVKVRGTLLYMQFAGISAEKAKQIVISTSTRSFIPEPVRVAHMIAAGVVSGRSHGHA